eukprot:9494316-Pyramimonas_sp.AAC.1
MATHRRCIKWAPHGGPNPRWRRLAETNPPKHINKHPLRCIGDASNRQTSFAIGDMECDGLGRRV